jgi:NitT/TauT family transport system permease protein
MRLIRIRQSSATPGAGRVFAIQLAGAVLLIILWQCLIRARLLNPFYTGEPSQIGRDFIEGLRNRTLIQATEITMAESLAGFCLGTLAGSVAGLTLWWSARTTMVLRPALTGLNAVPKIIFAPVFILLVGVGFAFKVASSASGVSIVALLAALAGTQRADPDLVDLVRAMGGKRRDIFWLIVVPAALPWMITASEINIGIALVGAVVGEFLSSNAGLGYLAVYAAGTFDMSLVLVSVSILMALSAGMYGLVRILSARLIQGRGIVVT